MTPETGSADTYSYDANGNMTCRIEGGVTYTQTYNAENRISSIAKRSGDCATGTIVESWSFAYDGDGVRVMTAHFTGTSGTPDSTTSYFMGGAYEVKDGATKKYYSITGMTIAMHDGTALQYLLTDHLGSTVAVTNASGTLTSQQRYLPFGAPRTIPNSPIVGTDFGYIGQRLLDEDMGGIMDYRARFYSPMLGRFLQPDSIIPDQSNPQSWNRFGYVLNNPIRFNDPTGHWGECENDPNCSAVLDTYVKAAIRMVSPLGINTRPRWLMEIVGDEYSGIGLAKVSDAEMEGDFGKIVDKEHVKVGLGLRDESCQGGCEMDQDDPDVAAIAMRTRLSMRLDICVQNGCSNADMFVVAVLAGDERITWQALNQAFKNDKYNSDNGIVTLNWEKFLKDNWPKDPKKNKDLINLFSKNVKKLDSDVLSEGEWEYIGGLAAQ